MAERIATHERCVAVLLEGPEALPLVNRFHYLQALEDAICYRTGRAAAPCAGCGTEAGELCDEHFCDAALIRKYEQSIEMLCAIAVAIPGPLPPD
jgi:hypothetical protein